MGFDHPFKGGAIAQGNRDQGVGIGRQVTGQSGTEQTQRAVQGRQGSAQGVPQAFLGQSRRQRLGLGTPGRDGRTGIQARHSRAGILTKRVGKS